MTLCTGLHPVETPDMRQRVLCLPQPIKTCSAFEFHASLVGGRQTFSAI